jgi:hypothetical protein
MSASRTSAAALLVSCALLAPGLPSGAEEVQRVDGRVGLGGLFTYVNPGLYPSGAYDLRFSTDLRLDAENLGGKPVGVSADGDLYLDADDQVLRTYRLVDLNVHFRPGAGPVRIAVGRQRVAETTEELVDGVGVRGDLGKGVYLGGYGGLIPEPFTTLATVGTGGAGVVFGVKAPRIRVETAAGFSARSTGFDHGFAHVSSMAMPMPSLSLYGRLKVQGYGGAPGLGFADVFTGVSWRPVRILRVRGIYNAYSSERYVDLVERNPTLSRFAARADALDLLSEIPNDTLDRALYHQLGADVDARDGQTHGAIGVRGRYRMSQRAEDGYGLAELHGGLVELGRGGADIRFAGRYIRASGRDLGQGEVGFETYLFGERLDLGVYVMFSGSPALEDETRPMVGVYGDVFASLWFGKGWSLSLATRLGWEDNEAASEVTVDGLLKVNWRFHTVGRKAKATEPVARF